MHQALSGRSASRTTHRSSRRGRRAPGVLTAVVLVLGAVTALITSGSGVAGAAQPACLARNAGSTTLCLSDGYATPDGTSIVQEQIIDAHTEDLLINSTSIGTAVWVRLMIPADWWVDPMTETFPTLYLLEGSGDIYDYKGWFLHTNLEQFLWNQNVLTVLPTDAQAGMYTDWVGRSVLTNSTPGWETFHTVELPDLLAHEYRANGTNAIMGASVGGLGAIDYAERHPGLYKAAVSMSGLLDTQSVGGLLAIPAMENRAGDNLFGPYGLPGTVGSDWAEHNPSDPTNVGALVASGTKVFLTVGNGMQGAYDATFKWDSWLAESQALSMTTTFTNAFTAALNSAGIAPASVLTTDFYGAGGHDWPYWNAKWPEIWPMLKAALNPPAVQTVTTDLPPLAPGVIGSQPFPQ